MNLTPIKLWFVAIIVLFISFLFVFIQRLQPINHLASPDEQCLNVPNIDSSEPKDPFTYLKDYVHSPFAYQSKFEGNVIDHLKSYTKDHAFKITAQQSFEVLNFLNSLKSETIQILPLNTSATLPTIADIDYFNNNYLAPLLRSLSSMDYFRFVKLNLNRKCTFWDNVGKCSERGCKVEKCDESQLPPSILNDNKVIDDCDDSLSSIDRSIPAGAVETMNLLFECYEHDTEDGEYFDLVLNPERYTGYKGYSAHRVWRSIYDENCFRKGVSPFSREACQEESLFYRAISGLHSSINIHLCAYYESPAKTFVPNVQEFKKRFLGHKDYLRNLYFLYLLELRALHKSESFLSSKINWQSIGDQNSTREAIKSLMKIVKSFKWHINEKELFGESGSIGSEFGSHFHNITTFIMDCVGCDKCKLWGKTQIHGLGTSFKILITDSNLLYLNRHEIITLINALARLSNSIVQLETFHKLLQLH